MITAFDVLEHLRDPRVFLRRLRSWLRDDGRLVLTLPDVSSFYARWLMRRHWFFYLPNEHLYYYDPRTRYAAANLRNFNAGLGGIASALVAVLPEALAARAIPMYVGEMMVFAEPR